MKRSFGVPDDDLAFTLAQRYKDSGDDAGHLARYVLRGSATALSAQQPVALTDEVLVMAERYKGRGDNAGQLARAVLRMAWRK